MKMKQFWLFVTFTLLSASIIGYIMQNNYVTAIFALSLITLTLTNSIKESK